jgi:Uncharacterized conserved protein
MSTQLRHLTLLLIVMACVQPAAAQSLPTAELTINGRRVTAEVATTVATRAVGLMRRFSLRPDHGMLFVFDAPQPLTFWMKNTYIPLSIAFIGGGWSHPEHRGHGTADRKCAQLARGCNVCARDEKRLVRAIRDYGR